MTRLMTRPMTRPTRRRMTRPTRRPTTRPMRRRRRRRRRSPRRSRTVTCPSRRRRLRSSARAAEEESKEVPDGHVHLPPAAAAFFGPGGCVATFRSPTGTCVMQTRCKGQEVPDTYEYGLTCVDDKGVSTRHLFGAGSFDPVETFDTLIKCDLCLGVDGQKATPEMKELADDVLGLKGEMAVLKDDVKMIKDHLDIGKGDEKKSDDKKADDKTDDKADDKADETTAAPDTLFLRGKSVQKKVAVAPQTHHAKHRARPGVNHPVASLHSHVDADDRH